ncbi:MAG: hypothetical protein HUJ56_02085, partial [Erysipelotrichaceae bacterium]|nr:hypothetical protein [Erysipelotrichaceae bacterium]
AALEINVSGGNVAYGNAATSSGADYTFDVKGLNSGEKIGNVGGTPGKGDATIHVNTELLKDNDVTFNSGTYLDAGTYNGTGSYNLTPAAFFSLRSAEEPNSYVPVWTIDLDEPVEGTSYDGYQSTQENANKLIYIDNLGTTTGENALSTLDAGEKISEISNKFNAYNYEVTSNSTYTVNQQTIDPNIKGQKTYGDETGSSGKDTQFQDAEGKVQVSFSGLKNNENLSEALLQTLTFDVSKLKDNDAEAYNSGVYLNAGVYKDSDTTNHGITITNWSNDTIKDATNGLKASNYKIGTTTSEYTVAQKDVAYYVEAKRTYGEATTNQGGANEYKNVVFGNSDISIFSANDYKLANGEEVTQTSLRFNTDKLDDHGGDGYTSGTYLDVGYYTSELDEKINDNYQVTISNWTSGVTGEKGFLASNYNLRNDLSESVYEVTPKEIGYNILGERYYGNNTTSQGGANEYTGTGTLGTLGVTFNTLANTSTETVNQGSIAFDTSLLKDDDGHIGTKLDADTYSNKVTIADWNSVTGSGGFKNTNYTIGSESSTYLVKKAELKLTVEGEKVYGEDTQALVKTSVENSQYSTVSVAGIGGKGVVVDEITEDDLALTNSVGKQAEANLAGYTGVISGDVSTANLAKNYTITTIDDNYKVLKRQLKVTNEGKREYGEAMT